MTTPDASLRAALGEPVTPLSHETLMTISREAEAEARRTRRRLDLGRLTGRTAAVIAGVTISGAVIAAAAVPFALDVLFPPPVSTSFTFESGVVCDVDIRVAPDFASSDNPEAAMDAAQRITTTLDLAALPIQRALGTSVDERTAAQEVAREARERAASASPTAPTAPTANPYAAESDAISRVVVAKIWTELADKGFQGGVSIESRISCE